MTKSKKTKGREGHRFTAKLWRYAGPNGWTFVTVPSQVAPDIVGAFGRTPVRASVDGGPEWPTSTWRDTRHGTVLAIPKRQRGQKDHGDTVVITLVLDVGRM